MKTQKEVCLHKIKPVLVFQYKNTSFYGTANSVELIDYFDKSDLVIACGIEIRLPIIVYTNRLKHLQKHKFDHIYIDWLDGFYPDLTKEDWRKIIEACLSYKNVAFQCMGGHGRTGTALCIVAHFLLNPPDCVRFIREKYCNSVVETEAQIEYIEKITGKRTKEKPHKSRISYLYNTYLFTKKEDKKWEQGAK